MAGELKSIDTLRARASEILASAHGYAIITLDDDGHMRACMEAGSFTERRALWGAVQQWLAYDIARGSDEMEMG